MTTAELKKQIEQGEGAKVDFKREWYRKEELKGEFVKDMFALTNGDVHGVKESSFLIIGIDDDKNFFKFDDSSLPRSPEKRKQQLLNILNSYAQPEFTDLEVKWVDLTDEQEVMVISVLPRGRLISLSKDLQLKNRTDKKGTVYYRAGEDIRVASADMVEEFRKAYEKEGSNGGQVNHTTHNYNNTTGTIISGNGSVVNINN